MKDGAGKFAGNLEHVGDHEQEALACGKGCRKRSDLKGAVDGSCCSGLGLHFI